MAVEIRVPSSGESVVEATVGRWYKQPGEAVKADEDVVELETDKVNVTVQAGVAGVLESILRQTGEIVGINDVLATVAEGGAATNGATPVAAVSEASAQAGASAASLGGTAVAVPPAIKVETPSDEEPLGDPNASATPTAARMLELHGLKASEVKGSGPNGKVMKGDVQNHVATINTVMSGTPVAPSPTAPTTGTGGNGSARPTPYVGAGTGASATLDKTPSSPASTLLNPLLSEDRREIVEPMSRLRKTIAAHLVEGQHNAAMLTTFNEVDMTAIMEIRKRRKDTFKEKHGVGLGFMSFFTKAVIGALKAFPYLNAEIQGDNIIKKQYYDIGIAVGTERGLVVPVVRNADRLTFAGIEKEIGSLAGKARDNKLSIAEITGGTFTITNGGVYGSLMSTPILNAPQVGILGMHKIEERPIALNGQVVIRPMMYLALSYDHRIVDGGEAVRFLVRVKELLEDPENLLLEG
jgi:2-oxoglutarate dehydrogenase E2 component (dihydrolipoamide succinyltransferase)